MKRVIKMLLAAALIAGCFAYGACGSPERDAYINISAQQARELMATETDYIILDVRTEDEYAEGHIPGAVVIPHDQIAERADEVLKDKDQLILVYCRSGRRSKIASEMLVSMGYNNIREFGGIIDWPYEIVTE